LLVKCEQCGNEFEKSQAEVNRTTHHYCSRLCSRTARSNLVIVKCEQCGIEFKKTHSHYKNDKHHFCSNKCKFENRNKKVKLICETCGKTHYKAKNQVDRSEHHFCSHACSLKYQDKKVEKVCPACGAKFYVPPSMEHKRIFCSKDCKFEDLKTRETGKRKYITCDNCGKNFLRYNYRLTSNQYNFCSYECMGEFKRNDDYDEDYYDSKEWKELRLIALLRDKQKCCECGIENVHLVVHHITPRTKGGKDELNNLKTLCNTCHIKTHLKDLQDSSENIKIQNFYKKVLKSST
jgi:endogenous inhibitor of DNA gyrase (YacG/DUF329 family)